MAARRAVLAARRKNLMPMHWEWQQNYIFRMRHTCSSKTSNLHRTACIACFLFSGHLWLTWTLRFHVSAVSSNMRPLPNNRHVIQSCCIYSHFMGHLCNRTHKADYFTITSKARCFCDLTRENRKCGSIEYRQFFRILSECIWFWGWWINLEAAS